MGGDVSLPANAARVVVTGMVGKDGDSRVVVRHEDDEDEMEPRPVGTTISLSLECAMTHGPLFIRCPQHALVWGMRHSRASVSAAGVHCRTFQLYRVPMYPLV